MKKGTKSANMAIIDHEIITDINIFEQAISRVVKQGEELDAYEKSLKVA